MFILRRGFTLTEVVTVVIIVGILVTLALPMFVKTMETARAQETVVALRQIRAAEKIYRTQENFCYPRNATVANIGTINNFLRIFLDRRTNRNWDYVITAAGNSFTATATRTSGRNNGETITIDQTGTIDKSGWSP